VVDVLGAARRGEFDLAGEWASVRLRPHRDLPVARRRESFPPASAPGRAGGAPTIDPWLWQSILATIFCCQPLGVVGIAFAAQSQTAMSLGSYDLARRKANTARTWTLWSAGVMLIVVVLWFLFFAIGIASLGF
jgi:hypothetical protein